MTITITHRFDRLDADEKDLCNSAIRNLTQSSELNNFGCIYVIERAGNADYRKVGVTDSRNLPDRVTKIALGDPTPHRVASLCLFYDRDIAGYVEGVLKKEYKTQGLHSRGGTEWYTASRERIVSDVHRISHQLMLQRLLTENSDGNIIPLHKSLHGFFGLCIFHIAGGRVLPHEIQSEILDSAFGSDDTPEKRSIWAQMMNMIQSLY